MHAHYLLLCTMNEVNFRSEQVVDSDLNKKALDFSKACGDEWARTTDSRIFSPMLYQLSYITLIK